MAKNGRKKRKRKISATISKKPYRAEKPFLLDDIKPTIDSLTTQCVGECLVGATDPGKRYGDLNQDAYFLDTIQTLDEEVLVTGVFDGHGKHGEYAAQVAARIFKESIRKHITESSDTDHEQFLKNLFKSAHEQIIEDYNVLDTLISDGHKFSLMHIDNIGIYQSESCPYIFLQDFGTTAVVCLYFSKAKKLIVANCGDSDAILAKEVDGKISTNVLTVSHNIGQNNEEKKRIKATCGRDTLISRGYLSPRNRTYSFHKLAMTRALGHKFLEKYGVVSNPVIKTISITPNDKLLVVGSDGLFDVVDKKSIGDMVHTETVLPVLCKNLVHLSLEKWKEYVHGKDDMTDNITVCVLKFNP